MKVFSGGIVNRNPSATSGDMVLIPGLRRFRNYRKSMRSNKDPEQPKINKLFKNIKKKKKRTCPAMQGGVSLILGQGTKIPHATGRLSP